MLDLKVYPKYIKALFNLAIPMIIGNLGMILIGAGDVFVAAKHSTETLAAISIGNSVMTVIFLFGTGLLIGISPLLSNFRGERQNIKKYFVPSIIFSIILAAISVILVLLIIPIIDYLNFETNLVPLIKKYMFITAFSAFGAYLQVGLKEYLQAFEIVIFPNLVNLFGVIINVFFNFVFVFGWYGLPEMGVAGLAVSTVLSRSLFGFMMLIYCLKIAKIKYYKDFGYFVKLLKIGMPIAAAIVLEVLAFNLITIIEGRVAGIYAAAQNILLVLSLATFMIPMAISNAIAVKVGYANGAGNFTDLKRYSISGIGVSVGFMMFCAINFIFFPEFFINIFTQDYQLVKICVPILMLAGFFQIFDGLQVSLGGVFKGIKNTKVVMIGNFLAYWVVGLPLGIFFAFKQGLNLYGFWIGLTIAICLLGLILLLMLLRYFKKLRKEPVQN